MKNVKISVSKEYEVLIGTGLLENSGKLIRNVCPKSSLAAVISDDNVAPLYMDKLRASLETAGFSVISFVFPHGEISKNAETYVEILNFLAENRVTRADLLVALGGGVVGDITGFAAATYLRGVKFVQVPTSLLAMVDSSVGGKTAIDLKAGKNLAGAFCQPELVICDLDTLDTLSPAFFADGCAEVIKYGILADKVLFEHLLSHGQDFDREYVISRCVELKRDYVTKDEFDTGVRMMLNLGHTVGHAIEKLSNYTVSHGFAVAMGMGVVSRASAARGICTSACAASIEDGLKALNLPVNTAYSASELVNPMLSDKKRAGGTVNLIVPYDIGSCGILPTSVDELLDFVSTGL